MPAAEGGREEGRREGWKETGDIVERKCALLKVLDTSGYKKNHTSYST